MRAHDQTDGLNRPRRPRALVKGRAWALLLVACALSARADDPPPSLPASDEPVTLSADRIRYWDTPEGDRWVILEGRAGAFLGTEGLRADSAAVHITRLSDRVPITRQAEVYAEGHARTTEAEGSPRGRQRLVLSSRKNVFMQSHGRTPPTQLDGPPRGLAILAHGFPDALAGPVRRAVPEDPAPRVPVALTQPPADELPPPRIDAGAPAFEPRPKRDDAIKRAQDLGEQDPFPDASNPVDIGPMNGQDPNTGGLPAPIDNPLLEGDEGVPPGNREDLGPAPLLPGTQRALVINPRTGGPNFDIQTFETPQGEISVVIRGGVNIVATIPGRRGPNGQTGPPRGDVDISADSVVIWTRRDKEGKNPLPTPGAGAKAQDDDAPVEIYLEGHVEIIRDKREQAGNADQVIFKGDRAYYNVKTERMLTLDGEVNLFAPGMISPLRTTAARIEQFQEPVVDARGRLIHGPTRIRADKALTTGSRFPDPGYSFWSRTIDIDEKAVPAQDPNDGTTLGPSHARNTPKDTIYHIEARANTYYAGSVPIFYLPKIALDSDFDPLLRNIQYRYGNYFGHQVLSDISMFRLLNVQKPRWIDNWNLDIDYLSLRGLAAGSEIAWFGNDLIGDLTNPYHKPGSDREVMREYFGYFDIWGLQDTHNDVLGPGPSILTNGPFPGAGKAHFQRTDTPIDLPTKDPFRGRVLFRHMQSLLSPDADVDEDFRVQVEAAYISDRNFLEEYYKRLFDSGIDQSTLAYGIYQKRNWAATLIAQPNLQNWYTDTQWMPRADYYRLGDSLLGDRLTYFHHSGVDYANTHTASEVNNPNIFAFIPFDPVSNTSGPLRTGRMFTSHELDLPIDLDVARVIPYAQGQLAAWDNQLGGEQVGRAWGAVGARANLMAWRTFDNAWTESELLNIHGLAHKVNFDVDFRTAYSNVSLQRIGVQDQLDDNTYEYVRRYFALTNYVGGLLPPQYDPRLLTLRRTMSPISFTNDVQDQMMTAQFGIHQRLQTKRGREGQRRIVDYMVLDLTSTYFPNANRDNFGKPFGQNMYNFEWYVGDRTSILSSGWFEFWDVQGDTIAISNPRRTNDPFGLTVVTAGVSLSRPPRGNVYLGYSIINTGPIATSALNAQYSYWLSPKWYTTASTSYDFGNAILLGATFAFTRIGADYLTSIGLTVDPQRMNYTFGFELAPRFSPNMRLGSITGYRFDSRFAPTQ